MYQVNDIIVGKIFKIKPYALFLEFEDGTQGLLHISELSDLYIKDIEKYGSIGDELTVKVLSIDSKNGFLRVSYKAIEENKVAHTKNNSNIRKIEADPEEWKLIEDNLDNWIKTTLEKMEDKNDD